MVAPLLSREEVKAIQAGSDNVPGIDWFGEPLLVDGNWGPKTAWWAGIQQLEMTRQCIVRIALEHYRLKRSEDKGRPNRGGWVDEIVKPGGIGLGHPWCAAFVANVLQEAGADWPLYHMSAYKILEWAKATGRIVKDPLPGDVFAFMHNQTEGHVGIVLACDLNWICDVDGNVGNKVSVGKRARDGLTFIRTVSNSRFPLVMPPTDKLLILDGPTR
jgi:hypothetical protein